MKNKNLIEDNSLIATCKYVGIKAFITSLALVICCSNVSAADSNSKSLNSEAGGLYVPLSRSELVIVPQDIAEVIVADPDIADVHVIGAKRVAFIGKKIGRTNAKLFDKNNNILRQFDVVVGYDLPAIRKALHFFMPHEHIGIELVNTNLALVGEISDASMAERAIKIVDQFVRPNLVQATTATTTPSPILNLMKVTSGQQVMLHVRVGEIERSALKNLGVDLAGTGGGAATIIGGTNGGVNNFITQATNSTTPSNATLINSSDTGLLGATLSTGNITLRATLEALETEGVFKVLAEPDLVAVSGEKAEFLAGGEFPIIVPQVGGGTSVSTVQFKDFGVAVQFIPYVLSENRIRIAVQPEVSEINTSLSTTVNGTSVPALNTRRAKTTVELAPGESFMIAGLLQDRLNSTISQVPGASEIPILGALLRSTSYNRDETELVIAVTPYIVDPLKSNDVRMPTDDFRPASVMEQFFYGTLGAMSGNSYRLSQTPSLEGPIGFMTD